MKLTTSSDHTTSERPALAPPAHLSGGNSIEKRLVVKRTKRKISLMGLLSPYWKALVIGMASVFGGVLADVLQFVPVKVVIDNVLGGKPVQYWAVAWIVSTFGTGSTAMLNFAVAAVFIVAVLDAVSSY